jgi:hypothetical protein
MAAAQAAVAMMATPTQTMGCGNTPSRPSTPAATQTTQTQSQPPKEEASTGPASTSEMLGDLRGDANVEEGANNINAVEEEGNTDATTKTETETREQEDDVANVNDDARNQNEPPPAVEAVELAKLESEMEESVVPAENKGTASSAEEQAADVGESSQTSVANQSEEENQSTDILGDSDSNAGGEVNELRRRRLNRFQSQGDQ